MTSNAITKAFSKVATVEYTTRDLGYGSESAQVTGMFTGHVDTWGKYTFDPVPYGAILYLFADEIKAIRVLTVSELTAIVMGARA